MTQKKLGEISPDTNDKWTNKITILFHNYNIQFHSDDFIFKPILEKP